MPDLRPPPDLGPMLDLEAASVPATAPVAPAGPLPSMDSRGFPVVAGYEVLESHGQGTGGVRLYRARQLLVGRDVLLQVVFAREDSSQKAWNCLRSEASGHGKLTHPNVLCLYEIGERDRQLFYNAMEFIDGPTLAQKVADKPLPFDQIFVIMELLARAVAYANEQNVLHRHLEPSAVLLQRVPAPQIASKKNNSAGAVCRLGGYYLPLIRGFGLARKPIEGDTFDAELYAEPGFLSPEQAWGRSPTSGPHTDVYGLGGILYFLLCGRTPFRGPSLIDIVDAIQTAPLVSPSDIRNVPESLQYICKKALSRPSQAEGIRMPERWPTICVAQLATSPCRREKRPQRSIWGCGVGDNPRSPCCSY